MPLNTYSTGRRRVAPATRRGPRRSDADLQARGVLGGGMTVPDPRR
ncbi:MAG: hypothetical protein AVDCRST_MAG66-3547 [uncultured Pseudonocardia sp.]|uniref:Uncharacterized protein n=1 Tax=uncultured Pseudonocardia sp. TaxID=211455 RepID=A0A6J4Q992_9PSEU|nr:MAG: hypothetical protein AVDCRST_MAG66-3547 [uncultured Pseudonocardia sp.]